MKARQVNIDYDPLEDKVNIEPVKIEESESSEEVETQEEESQEEETSAETSDDTSDDQDSDSSTEEEDTSDNDDVSDVDEQGIQEDKVFEYLSEKLGRDITSIEDFKTTDKEPELPEEVQKYLNFKKETGRGFEDFVKANRDISQLSDEDVLVEYVLRENEGFDTNDALEHLDDMFGYEEDASEKEKKKRDRLEKSYLAKARKVLREESEKYKVPVASTETSVEIPDEYKKALEFKQSFDKESTDEKTKNVNIRKKFEQETDKLFSDDFKGFELKLGDDVTETYKPSNVEDVKKANSDLGKALGKFFHEDGSIKDVQGYHKALTAAFDPDAFAAYFYEKGKNEAIGKKVDSEAQETRQTSTGKETTKNNNFAKSVDVKDNGKAIPTSQSFGTKFKMKHYR